MCIRDSVYANALEKLRPHSEIIHFQKPSENALMERLEYVCKKEKVHVSKTLLKELAVLSQGDVRNSLNNLQFMTKNGFDKDKLVTNGSDAEWTDDKRKDIGITWFKICNSIFKRDPYLDVKLQLKNLLRDVETSGNYERIIEGCFTLFPEAVSYTHLDVYKRQVLLCPVCGPSAIYIKRLIGLKEREKYCHHSYRCQKDASLYYNG